MVEDVAKSSFVNCLQTPEEDNAYLDLRQENDELLRRLAAVQQQMWTLEEKVTQSTQPVCDDSDVISLSFHICASCFLSMIWGKC